MRDPAIYRETFESRVSDSRIPLRDPMLAAALREIAPALYAAHDRLATLPLIGCCVGLVLGWAAAELFLGSLVSSEGGPELLLLSAVAGSFGGLAIASLPKRLGLRLVTHHLFERASRKYLVAERDLAVAAEELLRLPSPASLPAGVEDPF